MLSMEKLLAVLCGVLTVACALKTYPTDLDKAGLAEQILRSARRQSLYIRT